ncbi:MAG: hypothetical protein IJA67_15015 [Oscillospiraceae bacterium]|nr:hypothetical protein [Oscillospiraceae bacterium]
MRKRIFGLLLCLLLSVTSAFPACAANQKTAEKEPLTISTPEELQQLAEQCRLDTYSVGLSVVLTEDIDLSGTDFSPIPVFAGSFDGGGHRITGLHLREEGSVYGLFRYLTDSAVVSELTVEAEIVPDGSRSTVGGIAGSSAGTIMNCVVQGTISGNSSVGGIVGVNTVTGIVESCTVNAAVSGLHFAGGICGTNMGVVRGCSNYGEVNATSEENTVEISDITIESLTNSDSAGTATDIGGIAGRSSGVIRSCTNYGTIGYRQMGYNVGGIAGTQSGYVADCVNRGDVSGRKEVGGIVGQMEPLSKIKYSRDALQILQGQLNTLSGLTNRAAGNAESGSAAVEEKIGQLREQTDTAKEAVKVLLPGGGDDFDAMVAAQNALAESLGSMPETMKAITGSAKDTSKTLTNDLKAISEQITSMGSTLNAASQALGTTFRDVSDSDKEGETGGKVQHCVNHGAVLGDRNVGGISGAMALENDLNPEDDWQVSGESSMNVSTELRAVLVDCENRGTVTLNKENGGGIVGWQYLGLVKNSLNAGNITGGADYVGGIVGRSSGYVRGNSAKCSVSGNSYVGGIGGYGEILTECRSVVMLSGSGECIGAVLGQSAASVMETDAISENYYMVIDTDYGAIDGISYGGKAESKNHESFLELDAIPDPLRSVTVRFVYENGRVKEIELPLGAALTEDMIPAVPEKAGYGGYWAGLAEADTQQVLFDLEFVLTYISDNTVLESEAVRENGKPVVLVQGNFTPHALVAAEACEERPKAKAYQTVYEVWSVMVSEPEAMTAVRYSISENCTPERMEILVRDDAGNWRTAEHHISGSYAVFDFGSHDTAFAVLVWPDIMPVLGVLLIGAVLLLWQKRKAK